MRAWAIIAINSAGWATLQLALARAFVSVDPERFRDLRLYRTSEREVQVYRALGIRRWKRWLPDGGVWVGSQLRKSLPPYHDADSLHTFEIETRRAELAHWGMILTLPLFLAFNPQRAWPVLMIYAGLSNFPCILAQRYNRYTIRRMTTRSRGF